MFRHLLLKRRRRGVTGAPRRIGWRRKVSVSVAAMTTFLVLLGLAWLAAASFAERLVVQGSVKDLLGFLQALAVIFLSSLFGGLILKEAFHHWLDEDPDAGVLTGIASIHPSREAARQQMLDWVDDPETRTIWLVGISHRDFLQPAGRLRDVWSAIYERLRQESNTKLPKENRLHVRMLLLNPNSSEGLFRRHIEAANLHIPEDRIGLKPDVEAALTELDRTNLQLYSEKFPGKEKYGPDGDSAPGALVTEYLQTRLYEHCSFAFTFLAETAVPPRDPPHDSPPESSAGAVALASGKVLIEQYMYRGLAPSILPVLEFASGGKAYDEIHSSVLIVWRHACPNLSRYDVGTAKGLSEADIRNIFAQGGERTKVSERELESILNACESMIAQGAEHQTVDVLAVSAKFYLRTLLANRKLMEKFSAVPGTVMRCALVNPVSQQAIMRAIADEVPPDESLLRWRAGPGIDTVILACTTMCAKACATSTISIVSIGMGRRQRRPAAAARVRAASRTGLCSTFTQVRSRVRRRGPPTQCSSRSTYTAGGAAYLSPARRWVARCQSWSIGCALRKGRTRKKTRRTSS